MNLKQLLDKLKTFAAQLKWVNNVTIGDIYDNWNAVPDNQYGIINIDIPNIVVNENMQQMHVFLYYGDRLLQDTSNEYDVKTTAELVLNNIINYAAELGDVSEGWQINFFTQLFADMLAGGYVEFDIEVRRPLDSCLIDEYEDDPQGVLEIVENGTYDVTEYKRVVINVPSVTTEEITQAEYDALSEYDPYKIYLITE